MGSTDDDEAAVNAAVSSAPQELLKTVSAVQAFEKGYRTVPLKSFE